VKDPDAVAHAILRGRRFRGTGVPRPFHHALVWLGQPLARAYHWLGGIVPGGTWDLDVLIAVLVLVIVCIVAWRIAARRSLGLPHDSFDGTTRAVINPGELERRADEADRAGNPEEAVRLRFRAGMIRLGRARILPARESVTTGEARRILHLVEFDELARAHDEIVFASRPALDRDSIEAREGWPRVLEEATSRR
jgi:hypothetical protein